MRKPQSKEDHELLLGILKGEKIPDSEDLVLQQEFSAQFNQVYADFFRPLIKPSRLVKLLPLGNTAWFNFETLESLVSEQYVHDLEKAGVPRGRAIKSLLQHEIGHFAYFPKDPAISLFFRAFAEQLYGEDKGPKIYTYYEEAVDDLTTMAYGVGDCILEERLACVKLLTHDGYKRSAKTWQFFCWVYDNILGLKQGVARPKGKRFQQAGQKIYFKKKNPDTGKRELHGIDFFDDTPEGRRLSFVQFGNAIKDILPKKGKNKKAMRDSFGLDPKLLSKKGIEDALVKIADLFGMSGYLLAVQWLKKKRPDWKDPLENGTKKEVLHHHSAGLSGADMLFHPELVSFYRRWAVGPLYIASRPGIVDTTDPHKGGLRPFEPGDPITSIDVKASKGMLGVPDISKVRIPEFTVVKTRKKITPDLCGWKDASGSMTDPRFKSPETRIMYMLGDNYHACDSMVSGVVFSSDMAYLPPTRDKDSYYHFMTGWYGGGTVLNIEKLKEWLVEAAPDELKRINESKKIPNTSEKIKKSSTAEYEKLIAGLPHHKRAEFYEKRLEIPLNRVQQERLERLDSIICTDGFIWNIKETIDFMRGLAQYSRVFALLTNREGFSRWKRFHDPSKNVFVMPCFTPEMLFNKTIGIASDLPKVAREISEAYG